MLSTSKANGIEPHEMEIGLLDFLRELAQEEFPFPKFSRLRVVGCEDVLYAAMPNEREIAFEVRRRLKQAASELEKRLVNVQVVFKGTLKRGQALWVEYRGHRLPIDLIFGSPVRQSDAYGNQYYPENFGLT
jgi:hypothetical protein